ncbi:MAG: hypothetical protein MUC60_13585 [Oscillatoria sp. Prado101]|jgi:hypothetical protein|nr:hypothetical protein [Oscillatoria sp. Prado101]
MQRMPIFSRSRYVLPAFLGAIGLYSLSVPLAEKASAGESGSNSPVETVLAQQAPASPKPTFFEEERKLKTPSLPEEREAKSERTSPAGFAPTFVNDALGGVSDPLTGNGFAGTAIDSLQKLSNPAAPSGRPVGVFLELP